MSWTFIIKWYINSINLHRLIWYLAPKNIILTTLPPVHDSVCMWGLHQKSKKIRSAWESLQMHNDFMYIYVSLQPGCSSEEAMFLLVEFMVQQKTGSKPANQSQLFLQFPGPCNLIWWPVVHLYISEFFNLNCKCARLEFWILITQHYYTDIHRHIYIYIHIYILF